jgi:tRNA-splicing ligase RtcB
MASSTASDNVGDVRVTSKAGHEGIIYLPQSQLDEDTREQVRRMLDHPSVQRARVMPDCHPGVGCCVGFTCSLGNCVSPSVIGGDIGCGISALGISDRTARGSTKSLQKLLATIHAVVPMGNGSTGVHQGSPPATWRFLDRVLSRAAADLQAFAAAYDVRYPESQFEWPTLNRDWVLSRLKAWDLPLDHVLRQAGTLGGGNHFIEIGACDSSGDSDEPAALLVVHSGSRSVGRAVYRYWMHRALTPTPTKDSTVESSAIAAALDEPSRNDDEEVDVGQSNFSGGALRGTEAREYCVDMVFAQAFAVFNRLLMLTLIAQAANIPLPRGSATKEQADGAADQDKADEVQQEDEEEEELDEYELMMRRIEAEAAARDAEEDGDGNGESMTPIGSSSAEAGDIADCVPQPEDVINSTHNYIDFQDWVVRKGAIAAHKNQRCLIAQNMRDGLWLCEGLGNADWNFSAPHGTGRVKRRQRAAAPDKRSAEAMLRLFKADMEGIVSQSVTVDTLDERPSVYRNSDVVRNAMEGRAVRVLAHYKPILNCK